MSYPGSKGQAGVYQRIIGQMPPHENFVEAFAGSAVIFRLKRPAHKNYLIESNPAVAQKLVEEFEWKKRATVLTSDVVTVLKESIIAPSTVIYCDPPYLLSTRKGRRYYEHEMTDAQHLALLEVLKALDCNILISGCPSELYGRELRDWRCISYRTRTRGRTLTECLWCNFPEPTVLHDWRWAGQSHRQRVSLKRLAARWLGKLERMKPRQRGYLLDAIEQRHFAAGNVGTGVPAGEKI